MESLAGSRLGRFRITRLLGKGGMGEVYAARDEHLDRDVALKVLGAAVDVEPHRRRFLREARLAARLNHPNIASIHEVGDSDGRLYIVMELLEGQTLRDLLTIRKLTQEETLAIARDVARAVARAHAGEVIHRDIKPENIFITRPAPDILFAKVLDFGLARDELVRKRNDDENTATDVTGPGEACGTAGYLAPEQARGLAVDIRADIFSFGAVVYEMLTGKRAFDGRNHLARMLAVVKEKPEPLRLHVPDISPELEEVVERCLSKAAADRYPDGSALLAALEQLVRASQRMMPAVDVSASRLDSVPDTGIPTGPEMPALATTRDGSLASAKSISTVTPAPSTRSPEARRHHGGALVIPQRFWPFIIASVGGLSVGTMLLFVGVSASPSPSRPRRPAPVATARQAQVSGAHEMADPEEGATQKKTPSEVDEAAATAAAVAAAGPRSARRDKRPATLASLPPATATATASAMPSAMPSLAAMPPPVPVETPTTGTVRFQATDVMTIVVDGEHRRLRDGTVVLSCGRHRIRVGLNNERPVDVPCGGSVLF